MAMGDQDCSATNGVMLEHLWSARLRLPWNAAWQIYTIHLGLKASYALSITLMQMKDI